MDKLQIFKNNQFGEVRVVTTENGEPLFCLMDLCRALGLTNTTVVAQRLEEEEVTKLDLGGRTGLTNFITESGIYTVILRSDSAKAKPFRRWVTSEVLPSIRRHGAYMTSDIIEEAISNPDLIIQLATNLKAEREEKQRLRLIAEEQQKAINESKPKVLFADSVATSKDSVLVAELARILKQNGVDIGQNRLFEWLRRNGYLCSKGEYYNLPTQRAMEMGLFEVKKSSIDKPDGTILVTNTTKVTGKGQVYFVSKFIKVPAHDTAGC